MANTLIPSELLADDSVTLDKMAGLARGKIIYGDASGNPAALALGTNGQVLKSDGTDIAWATDAAGTITSVTNFTDNRVVTSSGSTTLNGEANLTFDGSTLTVNGNVSIDGGTIKLDGNYPVGTRNVALGNTALDDGSLTGADCTAVGANALTANTSGGNNTSIGSNTLFVNTTGVGNTALGSNALKDRSCFLPGPFIHFCLPDHESVILPIFFLNNTQ